MSVEIHGRKILKGVDLTVDNGEVHAIMCPNRPAEVLVLAHVLMKTQEFFK